MTIAIANDHAGRSLKQAVQVLLQQLGHEVLDLGPDGDGPVDYPLYVVPLARAVAEGRAELGIFLCGSGLGPAVAANKIRGIRAVTCHDVFSAKSSRRDNNANVLTMGERVIGVGAALEVVKAWLSEPWSGEERHQRRIDQITEAENAG